MKILRSCGTGTASARRWSACSSNCVDGARTWLYAGVAVHQMHTPRARPTRNLSARRSIARRHSRGPDQEQENGGAEHQRLPYGQVERFEHAAVVDAKKIERDDADH